MGLPNTQTISNKDLIELECDILIPAALENQIRGDNAERVRARLVVEAANGPTTPAADEIFSRAGIAVLPDILANAGGVTVSYFEWVQNIENEQWDLADVNEKLRRKMERAVDSVVDRWKILQKTPPPTEHQSEERIEDASEHHFVDLRTAAMVLAIERVANVALARGIWP